MVHQIKLTSTKKITSGEIVERVEEKSSHRASSSRAGKYNTHHKTCSYCSKKFEDRQISIKSNGVMFLLY